jgi:hypothetical protein
MALLTRTPLAPHLAIGQIRHAAHAVRSYSSYTTLVSPSIHLIRVRVDALHVSGIAITA